MKEKKVCIARVRGKSGNPKQKSKKSIKMNNLSPFNNNYQARVYMAKKMINFCCLLADLSPRLTSKEEVISDQNINRIIIHWVWIPETYLFR